MGGMMLELVAQEPAPRVLHSSIWTGKEMIVWGGIATNTITPGAQANGARFNPTTGLWQSLNTNGAPAPRYSHMAEWTGSRMIIYGGFGATGESTSTGSAYDPSTDSWSPLPTGNPPGACHDSAIAWTGTELLIWGGGRFQSGFNFLLSSGARLNQTGGSWSPLSVTNVPLARPATKSVWTGSELIVWGDRARLPNFTFDNLDTGARYNPATDTWTATSTTNSAAARNQHTAIWTGSRMIVWGGNGASSNAVFLNNGGAYDPAADSWTALTTNNAPIARRNHTAVWTGNRMLVWGGDFGSGAALNSGGAYDPVTDSWMPLPTSGAPPGRLDHKAVWTGYEMIVWGGSGSGGYQSNLVRYVPSLGVWNARPGVQLTAPVNGTQLVLPPLVTLNATALDTDGSVTNVSFFANGLPLGNATTAPYSFAWNSPPPGNYALTAVASDNSGLMTTSAVAQLSIALPNQAPTVAIVSPADNSQVVANGTLAIAAASGDIDGFVSSVEFRDGLSVIGTLNSPPWTLAWSNIALGPHALTAVATDNLGLSATSVVVNLEAVLVPQLEVFRDPAAWRLELTGGETGRVYRLDRTTNFLDWTPWQTNLATNGSFTTTDPDLSGPRRFYRAVP